MAEQHVILVCHHGFRGRRLALRFPSAPPFLSALDRVRYLQLTASNVGTYRVGGSGEGVCYGCTSGKYQPYTGKIQSA